MSLRTLVFNALKNDAALNALGINEESLFPNFAPDSPAAELMRFAVVRWGTADPPPGRDTTARASNLALWVYDRESDFTAIDAILERSRAVLDYLVSQSTGAGWVIGVYPQQRSEDFADDTYLAVGKSETYRIVASGT